MSIPDIGINANTVKDVDIKDIPISFYTEAIPSLPDGVSMQLPIIQMPGCVEAHIDSELSPALTENDPSRVAIFCDAGMPTFNSMNYTPELSVIHPKTEVPKVGGNAEADKPEAPAIPPAMATPKHSINTANTENSSSSKPRCKDKEILVKGKCITVAKPENKAIETVTQYLPPLEAATTTATIAIIATVSALLAKPISNFLLKLIKPMIKKIIAKIKKAMGKQVKPRSLRERTLAQRSRNQLIRQARDLMG
jgi:hypothetical protein